MGQYFIIVNLDRMEYIDPVKVKSGGWKIWEICANNISRILAYLLATTNKEGTSLVEWKIDDKEIGWKYKKTNYYGRWCGDKIAVIGDYAKGEFEGMFGYVRQHWVDITEEAVKEFDEFIEVEDAKIGLREERKTEPRLRSLVQTLKQEEVAQ
ncbi:MAG: hypothetical protein ACTSV7_09050 [Candidatus Baldrarchaeia archaeon]